MCEYCSPAYQITYASHCMNRVLYVWFGLLLAFPNLLPLLALFRFLSLSLCLSPFINSLPILLLSIFHSSILPSFLPFLPPSLPYPPPSFPPSLHTQAQISRSWCSPVRHTSEESMLMAPAPALFSTAPVRVTPMPLASTSIISESMVYTVHVPCPSIALIQSSQLNSFSLIGSVSVSVCRCSMLLVQMLTEQLIFSL